MSEIYLSAEHMLTHNVCNTVCLSVEKSENFTTPTVDFSFPLTFLASTTVYLFSGLYLSLPIFITLHFDNINANKHPSVHCQSQFEVPYIYSFPIYFLTSLHHRQAYSEELKSHLKDSLSNVDQE